MAFSKELAIIAQNSATAAATIVAALISRGDPFALESYEQIRTDIFNGTIGLAGAESVVEAVETVPATVHRSPAVRAERSNGGGNSRVVSRGESDPGTVEIRSGKHAGKTIRAVWEEDPEYIWWGADNLRNDFLRKKMSEFLGMPSTDGGE